MPVSDWYLRTKRRLFPKGVRRWGTRQTARVAHRTSERDFARCFESLRIPPGTVVCVHGAMSGFGHLSDGLGSVFSALQAAVPGCTIMMPSFPFSETMLGYLRSEAVFDPRHTPSACGQLSEALRVQPGARRGSHPTHACVAIGPRARDLIDGTESCPTPFGEDSSYGRFSRIAGARLLLLCTNSTSHVHRLQELANWPNLFLPDTLPARTRDVDGEIRTWQVQVHRPLLPLFVALPGNGDRPVYLWLPDYATLFPNSRERAVLARLGPGSASDMLSVRQAEWLRTGVMRTAACGPGEVMAIDLQPWQARLCQDLRRSLEQWPDAYTLVALEDANRRGLLR